MRKSLFALVAAAMVTVLGVGAGSLHAGMPGGPAVSLQRVEAFGDQEFLLTFKANEVATVIVMGEGVTNLDLFVYDEDGNLVAQDIGPTDRASVSWTPARQQRYTIKVSNLGRVFNRYVLATN